MFERVAHLPPAGLDPCPFETIQWGKQMLVAVVLADVMPDAVMFVYLTGSAITQHD